jgi:SAM-dependent methyltransferase
MPRSGELTYYQQIGEEGRRHAATKPFSDRFRGPQLMQVGAVLDLLPPPPARVLECGCGTGWLSTMIQRCGYHVVGVDVSEYAIGMCRASAVFEGPFADVSPPTFLVADTERMTFRDEFDVVLFFDSLHHSVDELAAVRAAYRALKPGGMMIASETPPGHHENSIECEDRFDVTEKDMPPGLIVRLGRAAGFRRHRIYPRADEIGRFLYSGRREVPTWRSRLFTRPPFNWLVTLALCTVLKSRFGITVLWK